MDQLFALLFLGGVGLFVILGLLGVLRRHSWPRTGFSGLRETKRALMVIPGSLSEPVDQPVAETVAGAGVEHEERKAA